MEPTKPNQHLVPTMNKPDEQDKQAIALIYDEVSAPTVGAKGSAEVAEEIIAIAREHGIPLYENPELLKSLSHLQLGEEIPELLYRVIAEIIAFAFHIQGKTPEQFNDTSHTT